MVQLNPAFKNINLLINQSKKMCHFVLLSQKIIFFFNSKTHFRLELLISLLIFRTGIRKYLIAFR